MADEYFEESYLVRTDAGLCGIWQPEHFSGVKDLEAWEDGVADDAALERHIAAGAFVPLNVGGDGTFQVVVRRGHLSDREAQYVAASSEPYLLISRGSLALGGLENVGGYVGDSIPIAAGPGRFAVTVHLIDWEAEPGAFDEDGEISDNVLPDFLVELNPEDVPLPAYRTKVLSFDRP